MDCAKCHTGDIHRLLPVKDSSSPVFLDHQVQVCGSCHEKYLKTYQASVHGHGLIHSGLLVTAVCSDCHGAHDIYYAADKRSLLHVSKVADTCGTCHAFIKETLQASIHGQGEGPGTVADDVAPGGKGKIKPSCTDCHQGHDLPHPDSDLFHLTMPNRCGNCHADYAQRYGMSLHGQLTELGYEPAAQCSDCHGAHDILPVDNSDSRLSPLNRQDTCRQCHPYAVLNFTAFDPHANFKDGKNYPLLHGLYVAIENFLYILFLLFIVHAFLWFTRSLVQTLRFGRHERLLPEQSAVLRYEPIHRILYGLLILCFFGLAITGLPLKYGSYGWAQRLANNLGGFETTRIWHQFFGIVVLVVCGAHLVWVVRLTISWRQRGSSWKDLILGPDSPVPNLRDLRDILGMACWFIGLTRKPKFERWSYWEKFDYWAVYLAVFLVAGSGLILWLPNLFTSILPGKVLNVAQMVHSATALLVSGALFVIHFFNTHLRPEKFPLDMTILTGLATETHLREARPEFVSRLQREGRLEALRTVAPSPRALRWVMGAGFVAVVTGLLLVGWMLFAYLGK
jgi:cytochrome b subunit of formate dehydrogenase